MSGNTAAALRLPWGIASVLLLLVLSAAIAWFLYSFEKEPYEVRLDMAPAARHNPLLAGQKYLQELGHTATSLDTLDIFHTLPPTTDAIVLRRLPASLSRPLSERLYEWVQEGGHLLFVPDWQESDHPDSHNLHERLGVAAIEDTEADTGKASLETAVNHEDLAFHWLLDVEVDNHPIHMKYFHGILLQDVNGTATFDMKESFRKRYEDKEREDDLSPLDQPKGSWLLEYTVGRGKATVLSELTPFYNSNIGNYDHAFFFSWLLRDAEAIWLVYGNESQPIFTILWKNASHLLISLFGLIVLWLWKMQKRSGNLIKTQETSRRNFLDHIDAIGRFNWRIDTSSAIVSANRKNLYQRLLARTYGRRDIQEREAESNRELAERFNMPEKDFEEAFHLKAENEQALIRLSRAQQHIQVRLAGGEQDEHGG